MRSMILKFSGKFPVNLSPMRYLFPLILILNVLFFSCQPSSSEGEIPSSIQNIVFIIGDDHATHALGAYGNSQIRTPNLDRLAASGAMFTHAYANAPMCSASRQSLLTGRYPHASGVTLLRTALVDSQITVAEHLKEYGYTTGAIGKMHFNSGLNHGFDYKIERKEHREFLEQNPPREVPDSIAIRPQWKPFRDHARIWLNAEARPGSYFDGDDIGTFYATRAQDFIERNKDTSFCLWVGFHEPHSPFNFPVEYLGRYQGDTLPYPTGGPEDDRWIPEVFSDLSEEEKRGIISAYYASVEYLDKNVGMILDKLEVEGLKKNTLIVYIGDHGYLLNHHKRFEKHMMWEEAVKAPLIISAPSVIPSGTVIDQMVEFVDLAPTLMDIISVDHLQKGQGKSLLPLIKNPGSPHKDYVFSEFLADNKAMVRTNDWKYIFTTGKRDLGQGYATGNPPPGITHRLYNLKEDPKETSDQSQNPEYQKIMQELQQTMLEHFHRTHPFAPRISRELPLEEQLMAFCEPPEGDTNIEGK